MIVRGSGLRNLIETIERVDETVTRVVVNDEGYRAAASQRAERITQLVRENEKLKVEVRKLRSSAGLVGGIAEPGASELIASLERKLEAERERKAEVQQRYDKLRRRLVVRVGLGVVSPIIRIRKLVTREERGVNR